MRILDGVQARCLGLNLSRQGLHIVKRGQVGDQPSIGPPEEVIRLLPHKPYVTRFDRLPADPRCGWFDELTISDGTTPEQLA